MKGFIFYFFVSIFLILNSKKELSSKEKLNLNINWPVLSTNGIWQILPLSKIESQFSNEMPGGIAKFTDGEKIYILRYVTRVTRKLHPISDCFKSSGFTIKGSQKIVLKEGKYYSTFNAVRDKESLFVMETFWDLNGKSWSDVSAWYWENYSESKGPWYSSVIINKIAE